MKINKILIWTLTFILLISFASATTYWSDNFNRADSGTIGNDWADSSTGTTGGEILSNTLKATDNDNSGGWIFLKDTGVSQATTQDDFQINFKIKIDTSTAQRQFYWTFRDEQDDWATILSFDKSNDDKWEVYDSDTSAYVPLTGSYDDGLYHIFSFRNWDTANDEFDLYVDDVLEAENFGYSATFNDLVDNFYSVSYSANAQDTYIYIDYINISDGVDAAPSAEVNKSGERTTIVNQETDVTLTSGINTILSSTFEITNNNTPLYGGYTFNVESNGANELYCEIVINSTNYANVTRTNTAYQIGSVFLQTPVFELDIGNYTANLECQRLSGGNQLTISNAVGVGHLLMDQYNITLPYNYTNISKTITSGSSFSLIDSINITTLNKQATNYSNDIIIEGFLTYTNNAGSDEELKTYISFNGTNCTAYPRDVSAGGTGSVGFDCILENVTNATTYQIDIYGNGSNAEYQGKVVVKNFFLGKNEIVGGTGLATGLTFSGDTDTALFSAPGGNENHDLSNVFTKISYSLSSDIDTTTNMWITITNGSTYRTINFTRYLAAGKTGVLIGQDILKNLPLDSYNTTIWGNCGTAGATCTIEGGQSGGYITDVVTTVFNSFNVTAYNIWDNSTINTFSVIDGATYNTTNGFVQFFTTNDYENVTINSEGYFNEYFLNHNTSQTLNVSMKQSDIKFRATEIISGNYVGPSNFTIDGITKGINESFYLSTGNYNVTFSKDGWYNTTKEINITALDNRTIILTDVSDSIINITAKHITNNESLTTFNGWIYEATSDTNISFSTTTGTALVSAASNLTFQIYLQSDNYTSVLSNFTVNTTPVFNYTAYLYKYNSFYINFYDELNLSKITWETVNLDLISDTYANNYSTNNGTLYITLLDPETYILEYGAENYNTRSYFITLNDDETETINLYLLSNSSDYETVTVTVVDEAPDPIEGLTVIVQKYFVETNSYENVAQQRTDFNGIVLFDLDVEGTFFKFIVIDDSGTILKETEPAKLTSTSFILTIIQDELDGEQYISIIDDYINIQNSLTFNNETNNFRLFYAVTGGASKTICLKVEKYSILGNTDIATSCATGSTATILVPITPINGSSYLATAYISSNNQEINRKLITFNTNPDFGQEGLLGQLILIILAIGIGIRSPKWLPITVTTSLWLGSILRLHTLGFDVCSGLLVAGIIITYYLERN